MFAEARPDLSLSSTEKAAIDESKEDTEPTEVASDGVRLYTFQISSYLNGHEVPKDEPVDFASVPLEHLPTPVSDPTPGSQNAEEARAENSATQASPSAFKNFLTKRESTEFDGPSDAEEKRLSDITWSIKYKISESRDQTKVIKALRKLRELQMTFSKYVLLPEGLPPQLVSSIVGNGTKQVKEKAPKHDQNAKKNVQKQSDGATGASFDDAETSDSAAFKEDSVLSKWAAFKPRSGVRYT